MSNNRILAKLRNQLNNQIIQPTTIEGTGGGKTATYTFQAIGLPSGSTWSVTLTNTTTNLSTTVSGITNYIHFTVTLNIDYTYTIQSPSGYFASPQSGTISPVASYTAILTTPIEFTISAQPITVTFLLGGLGFLSILDQTQSVQNWDWTVNLNGQSQHGFQGRGDMLLHNTIEFNLPYNINGYNFTTQISNGYYISPTSGILSGTQDATIIVTGSITPITGQPVGGSGVTSLSNSGGSYIPPTYESVPPPETPNIRQISKHIATDILSLYTQFGHDYQQQQGWFRVDFPKSMNSAHVVAVSGPRSSKTPRSDIIAQRRLHYLGLMEDGIARLLSDAATTFYNSLPSSAQSLISLIENTWNQYATKTGINQLYTLLTITGNTIDPIQLLGNLVNWWFVNYTMALWDYIIDPILHEVINSSEFLTDMYGYAEAFGLGKGRAMHHVDIRNVNENGFEWYSFGDMQIDWVAEGFNPNPIQIPPAITQAIDTAKTDIQNALGTSLQDYLKNEIQQQLGTDLKTYINNLFQQQFGQQPIGVGTPVRSILQRFQQPPSQ